MFTHRVSEHKSRRDTHNFRRDAFIKCSKAFILDSLHKQLHSSLVSPHIFILDSRFDDIHRRRNENTKRRADGTRDEILVPSRFLVIFEVEDVVLDEGGSKEESERARNVSNQSCGSASVEG